MQPALPVERRTRSAAARPAPQRRPCHPRHQACFVARLAQLAVSQPSARWHRLRAQWPLRPAPPWLDPPWCGRDARCDARRPVPMSLLPRSPQLLARLSLQSRSWQLQRSWPAAASAPGCLARRPCRRCLSGARRTSRWPHRGQRLGRVRRGVCRAPPWWAPRPWPPARRSRERSSSAPTVRQLCVLAECARGRCGDPCLPLTLYHQARRWAPSSTASHPRPWGPWEVPSPWLVRPRRPWPRPMHHRSSSSSSSSSRSSWPSKVAVERSSRC